jgi:uncharacterized protein (DUF58 family)
MAVSGLLGRYNLAGLSVEVVLPAEVYAGIETLALVHLHNHKRFPACLISVMIDEQTVLFPLVAGRHNGRRSLPLTLPRRGPQQLSAVTLRSPFPVNFFVRSFPARAASDLLVFPAPQPCRAPGADPHRRHTGSRPLPRRGSDGDIERIGAYRGEPLKMIHWKLTARQGELMVKELADHASEPLLVDLRALPGAGIEEQLRCACWLIKDCLRRQRPVGLLLPQGRINPATGLLHRRRLLTELALYGADTPTT